MGGKGFATLTIRNERLAYLQVIKDLPPQPMPAGNPLVDDGKLTLKFYELWNEPVWQDMVGGGDAYGALRLQARYGNLRLRKLIKSPASHKIYARVYDVTQGRWQMHLDHARIEDYEEPMFSYAGLTLPRIFSVTYPHATIQRGRHDND